MSDKLTTSVLAPPSDYGGIGQYSDQLRSRIDEIEGVATKQVILYEEMGAFAYVKAAVVAGRADVVHLQFEYGLFRPKLLYAWLFFPILFIYTRFRRIPVVITIHEVWTPETIGTVKYSYVWLVHALLAVVASRLVFMTEKAEEDFQPRPIRDTDCIPHGVAIESTRRIDAEDARDTFGYNSEDVVVSQIGYVSRRKGTQTFLSLARRHPEYEFLIAGGALRDEDESYFEQVSDDAPANVQITGVLSDRAFHEAFVATDVAVLAYRDIRQSGILNWCFAYGVPSVCRSIDRFEALHEQGAPLVLFSGNDNHPSIDEALDTALNSVDDRSEAMRRFGAELDLSRVATRYADLYRSLVSN